MRGGARLNKANKTKTKEKEKRKTKLNVIQYEIQRGRVVFRAFSQIMLMRFKNYEATLTIANARRSREQQKKKKQCKN